MKTFVAKVWLLLAALVYYIPTVYSLHVARRASPAVIEAKISRKKHSGGLLENNRRGRQGQHAQVRRDDTVDVDLRNEISSYVIEVDIGTPPQRVGLYIDTGSSDMWVNIPNSQICLQYSRVCNALGVFDADNSRTFNLVNNDFRIQYADGSTAAGSYVKDTVSLAGVALPSLQFALGNRSTSPDGVLGIGYRLNEAAITYGRDSLYLNLPAKLARRGLINSNAYSLWLNDLDASTGSILFGGVDQAKYQGTLQTLPIIPTRGYYTHFYIALTDVGLNGDTGSVASNAALPVLLDSGTTLMYLPDDIANALFNIYGAQYYSRYGAAQIDCSLANRDGSVDFTFSGMTISVPLNELVIPASSDGNTCAFGITRAGSSVSVLGDTFLRSAYVVYDLANNEISMAPTRFTRNSDIVEITSGPNAVPGSQDVRNPTSIHIGANPTGLTGDPGTQGPLNVDNDTGAAVGLGLSAGGWMVFCAALGLAALFMV